MRTTKPKPPVATQTFPAPVARPIAGGADAYRLHDAPADGIDARHGSILGIADPDRTVARGDGRRLRTGRDRSEDAVRRRVDGDHRRGGDDDRGRRFITCERDHEYQRRQRDGEEHAADDDAPPPAAETGARRNVACRADCSRMRSGRRSLELGILSEDRALETVELRSRLQTELAREQPAAVAVGLERLRLPAAAVEREHPLSPQALPQRVGCHERGEPPHDLGVAPETEQRLDLVLGRALP